MSLSQANKDLTEAVRKMIRKKYEYISDNVFSTETIQGWLVETETVSGGY